MRRQARTALGAAAIAFVGILAPAPAAQADSDAFLYVGGTLRATGAFTSDDEILSVYDARPDGHSAVIRVWYGSGSERRCWNHEGAGNNVNCDDNVAEGTRVKWRLCIGEYGTRTILNCTPARVDYA